EGSVINVDNAELFTITENTLIQNNKAHTGIINLDYTPAVIEKNSRFEGNVATNYGVLHSSSSYLTRIDSSEFLNNKTTGNLGTAVLSSGFYQITNSLFEGNDAPEFSVISFGNANNQYIRNSRFINNTSANAGLISFGNI